MSLAKQLRELAEEIDDMNWSINSGALSRKIEDLEKLAEQVAELEES